MADLDGHWDTERFGGLADIIAARLDDGTDLGCGVAVVEDGEVLADIRGGWRDRKQAEPFGDPLICIYSAGKAALAALIMRAVDHGELDYEAPVAEIWPDFGAEGKDRLTLAQALSHQAGLAGFTHEIDPALWIDWDGLCAELAAMTPLWAPGSANGYHPQTVGYIGGEVLRRATGRSVGEQLRELGLDIHCGLSADLQARTGPMVKPPAPPDLGTLDDVTRAAFLVPWAAPKVPRDEWMAAEIPASNMHATALGLAELGQAFASGTVRGEPFASEDARNQALTERITGDDLVLPFHLSWAAGLMLNTGGHFGESPTAAGHYGFGGAFLMVDPARKLSVAYVPNKMMPILVGGPRATDLLAEIDRVF